MATAVQVESLWNGLTDNNGEPLAAGKVFTYAAGTTTPVSLFTSSDKSTSATNPLILDANGKAQVWADGRYKFVVKTAADVTLYTLDNLLYGFDDTTVLYGGTSTGSANAQVVSVPATVTSYANGQTVSFVAGFTNTGATTLKFNSLAAITLVKGPTPSSLEAGDLIAGQLYTATYHGGTFRLQDYPSVADVQRSRFAFATGVSGTNTITATLTPALSSYETGMVVNFIAAATNTGAVTLNLNGLGAKTVQERGTALTGAELVANRPVQVVYDGTNFQIISNNLGSGTATSPAVFFGDDTNTGMYSPAADEIGLSINGTERVRIATQCIGVNHEPDPSVVLDLTRTGGGQCAVALRTFSTTASLGGNLSFYKSNTLTVDSSALVNNNDQVANIWFYGANGGTGTGYDACARIAVAIDGTPGASNDMPGRISFNTTPEGSATTVERMRIRSDGNVGIGYAGDANHRLSIQGETSTSSDFSLVARNSTGYVMGVRNDGRVGIGTSTPGATFAVNGGVSATDFEVGRDTGGVRHVASRLIYDRTTASAANVNVEAGATDYVLRRSTSSLKYKTNIQNATHGLAEVLTLRPVTYNGINDGDKVFGGLIAEEVHEAGLHEFVVYDDNNQPDALHYAPMVSLAFKAIQELNAKVTALEAKVQALEAATEV